MVNVSNTQLERIRSRLWALGCMQSAGTRKVSAFEKKFREYQFPEEWHLPSNTWIKHLKGERRPYGARLPRPDAPLVDRAELIWPFSAEVFYTPAWFLLEDREYTAQELLESAQALPALYKDLFVSEFQGMQLPGLLLKEVHFELAFDVSSTVSLWSFGALVVLMRRAELAGQIPVFRNALAAILWMLPKIADTVEAKRRYLYQRLRRVIVATFLRKLTLGQEGGQRCRLVNASYLQWFEIHLKRYLHQRSFPIDHPDARSAVDGVFENATQRAFQNYGPAVAAEDVHEPAAPR